jgi:hypothetical protein
MTVSLPVEKCAKSLSFGALTRFGTIINCSMFRPKKGREFKHMKRIFKGVQRLAVAGTALAITSAPMWALAGGRMAATQAITGAASEISGPFAYGASLLMVTGSAIAWYRHHHDAGALTNGALGTLFVAGTALGASTLMGFVPGVTGALI